MPFQMPTEFNPKKGSLIVCAGTVTCATVSSMGSGFLVFKGYFNQNIHHEGKVGGWEGSLQESLNKYNNRSEAMLAYIRIAKQGGYIGGVATVPYKTGARGLNFTKYSNEAERAKDFKEQYETAIKLAVLDAKKLNRPLFLQPLGIGVYGWSGQEAAELFAKAIVETDPADEVDITIPIFDTSEGSNDMQFQTRLLAEMEKRGRKPQTEKNEVIKDVNKDNPKAVEALQEQEAEKNDVNNDASPAAKELPATKNILIDIVSTLIDNIEQKKGGRWTSGTKSEKVRLLAAIKNSIIAEKEAIEPGSKTQIKYVQQIMQECQKRRNAFHFWATPDSVNEYKQLLKDNNIEIPLEQDIPKTELK
jgi:hypothetical protein